LTIRSALIIVSPYASRNLLFLLAELDLRYAPGAHEGRGHGQAMAHESWWAFSSTNPWKLRGAKVQPHRPSLRNLIGLLEVSLRMALRCGGLLVSGLWGFRGHDTLVRVFV